ncbi:MAG: NotI family restriction endonuclease [Flammeovirgaceae bacterium]|nr:NotI family restriction endonuclease [Flammeovirgaceae bacterium]
MEFFNFSTKNDSVNWKDVLAAQHCSYLNKKCIKVRKSNPSTSIGTCTVKYGKENQEVIICPHRLIEKHQIFTDCIHLLTLHKPGNEMHVIPEISIPGGSVDYFLVSVKDKKVIDFIGIELQTLDTTGTIWPERQRFLSDLHILEKSEERHSNKTYGMNWKMTAETTLVQLHHKIETFEYLNKHLVLVIQDHLLSYMRKEFSFSHINTVPKITDPMHFHSYKLELGSDQNYHIKLNERLSTDSLGLALAMGLKAEAKVELEIIIKTLETKISNYTQLTI